MSLKINVPCVFHLYWMGYSVHLPVSFLSSLNCMASRVNRGHAHVEFMSSEKVIKCHQLLGLNLYFVGNVIVIVGNVKYESLHCNISCDLYICWLDKSYIKNAVILGLFDVSENVIVWLYEYFKPDKITFEPVVYLSLS